MFDREISSLIPKRSNISLRQVKITCVLTIFTMITACQSTNMLKPSITAPKTETPTFQEADPRIAILLDEAHSAYIQNQLTTPLDNNAHLKYLQVMSIDPSNNRANQGIAEIVEKYLAWAMDAALAQNYQKAWAYVTKANSVDEDHPNTQSVSELINKRQQAKHMTFTLSGPRLKQRSDSILKELEEIALFIEDHGGIIVITARSDEEGRWIYQQLNNAGESRIRATFELNSTPKVHVSYQ
jgi:hypothetical protein